MRPYANSAMKEVGNELAQYLLANRSTPQVDRDLFRPASTSIREPAKSRIQSNRKSVRGESISQEIETIR